MATTKKTQSVYLLYVSAILTIITTTLTFNINAVAKLLAIENTGFLVLGVGTVLLSIFGFITSTATVFRLQGWKKIIPIIFAVVCFFEAVVVGFAVSFFGVIG